MQYGIILGILMSDDSELQEVLEVLELQEDADWLFRGALASQVGPDKSFSAMAVFWLKPHLWPMASIKVCWGESSIQPYSGKNLKTAKNNKLTSSSPIVSQKPVISRLRNLPRVTELVNSRQNENAGRLAPGSMLSAPQSNVTLHGLQNEH